MSTTPYINTNDPELIQIIGDKISLEILGHALLLKAKMGAKYQCIINDGINRPIKIISSDEFMNDDGSII